MSRNPPSARPARRHRAQARAERLARAREARVAAGLAPPDAPTLARWRAEMVATRGWGALITPAVARWRARAGLWRFDVDMTTCPDHEVAEFWRRARYDLRHPSPTGFMALARLFGDAGAARRALMGEEA